MNGRIRAVVVATVLTGGALIGTAHAAQQQQQEGIPASADTYVVREAPTTAYGTATKIGASAWADWHSEAYLRFDVPAGAGRITGARLDLTFQKTTNRPATVELRAVAGTWSETTTYATKPALGAPAATATVAAGTALSFDLTAAVTAAGSYSFALTNATAETAAVFDSREAASGPRLVLTYAEDVGPLCGASFTQELAGESYQQAFARIDTAYGGLDLARVFYGGLPDAWPGKLNTGGRPMNVSFKAAPTDVLAGRHDAALRSWFAAAPTAVDTYWTYYHEPEDNIAAGEFTAADYRAAWQRLSTLADAAGNPRLKATLVLMSWTLEAGSGRNWRDYYPGRAALDVLAWDAYNDGWKKDVYWSADQVFGKVVATSRAEGLPFAVAETGSGLIPGDAGAGRAAWARAAVAYLAQAGALYVAWFDLDWRNYGGPDYRLRDQAGTAAWREFCARR